MGGPVCIREECKSQNIELLRYVSEGLRNYGIDYWLDFGGLLGVIREGDMIYGDDDIDLCVTTDAFDKVIRFFEFVKQEGVYTVTQKTSYRKCGDFNGKSLMLYQVRPTDADNPALLDIFFFEKNENGTLTSKWTSEDDTFIDTIFPVQRFYVSKWDLSVNIPNDPTKRLIEKYGPDFMTPSAYKRTALGTFYRGRNVFSRCFENTWGFNLNWNILMLMIVIVILLQSLVSYS